jgi:hypothetical protein
MCALRRELAIDFADLRSLEIRCKCGTTVVFDVSANDTVTPQNCPGCREPFGDTFTKALREFKEAFQLFGIVNQDKKPPTVGVRIPFEG